MKAGITNTKKDSFDYVGLLRHCRLLARLQDLPYQNYLLILYRSLYVFQALMLTGNQRKFFLGFINL